jgi:choice-of-anchor A domain-containing protein
MPALMQVRRRRLLRTARNLNVRNDLKVQLSLTTLEDRVQPSAAAVDLGTAGQFGVLGLKSTDVAVANSAVAGNVGVSQNGDWNIGRQSTVSGKVEEYSKQSFDFFGHGKTNSAAVVNAALLTMADKDALQASTAAAALAPTQTLKNVNSATTLKGDGGLNVIDVNGDITASLTLSGTANDMFIVNVRGDLQLRGNSGLKLAGGVTADHVIYNFVGRNGTVSASGNNVINGTLLAPKYDVQLQGTQVNGEVIAGGNSIDLSHGVKVNAIPFSYPVAATTASLSGVAFVDFDNNGVYNTIDDSVYSNITVTLTGNDNSGKSVTLSVSTDVNGKYTFANLAPGTYTLTFAPPAAGGTVVDGTVGTTADGTVQNPSTVANIVLANGSAGVGYNFAVQAPLV